VGKTPVSLTEAHNLAESLLAAEKGFFKENSRSAAKGYTVLNVLSVSGISGKASHEKEATPTCAKQQRVLE